MAAEKAYKESFAVIWRKHKYKYLMIAPFGIIFIVFTQIFHLFQFSSPYFKS